MSWWHCRGHTLPGHTFPGHTFPGHSLPGHALLSQSLFQGHALPGHSLSRLRPPSYTLSGHILPGHSLSRLQTLPEPCSPGHSLQATFSPRLHSSQRLLPANNQTLFSRPRSQMVSGSLRRERMEAPTSQSSHLTESLQGARPPIRAEFSAASSGMASRPQEVTCTLSHMCSSCPSSVPAPGFHGGYDWLRTPTQRPGHCPEGHSI